MPYDLNIYNLNNRGEKIPCVCDFCGDNFEKSRQHITIQKSRNQTTTFCNSECHRLFMSKERISVTCKKCGKDFLKKQKDISASSNDFCSRLCSNIYANANRAPTSEETKTKISNSLKLRHKTKAETSPNPKSYKCTVCNSNFIGKTYNKRKTCDNPECRMVLFRQGGKNSATITKNRSKDEIELFELCLNYFTKVESNKVIFDGWDADIVIDNNILVFWNGPWHYKNIKMKGVSLKQIQNRDFMKINLFLDNNFQVFIYEDRYFTPNQAFDDLKRINSEWF